MMDELEQQKNQRSQLKEKLGQLKKRLSSERPVPWAEFPDIGLYKDQVVSYMQRQLIDFEGDAQITSAMINNYIKDKLLPRADGKKYSQEHLAGLTEICLLKQIFSVKNTGFLLHQELDGGDSEKFYNKFRLMLDKALSNTAGQIDEDWGMDVLTDMALQFAISSYCSKLVGERLLEMIQSLIVSEEQKKPDKKPEKSDKKPEKAEKQEKLEMPEKQEKK